MDTRKSLEDEVLAWLDESGDTSTTRTNVRNAIRQAHQQRLMQEAWPFLVWAEPQMFNLVVGQRNYPLHQEYGRSFYFWNTTEDHEMNERPMRNIKPQYTDEKFKFVLWNRSPVAAHPSSASTLTIVSSDSGDSGSSRGVRVRGMTSSGVRSETITPNGTTPVVSTYTYLPGGILQLSKFGTWTGDLTVTAGATSVVTLFPDESSRSYQQIHLLWEPDAADEVEYQFFRNPNPLEEDDSTPDIPFPHSSILVWDALLLLSAYDGRIDSGRLKIWKDNQDRMELALRQAFLDGSSLNAEPQGVHYIDED